MIARTLVALAILALPAAVSGESVDFSRMLVGTWSGDIQLHSAENPSRTLVVEAVDAANGTFRGKYAAGGKRLRPVHGWVERVGSFVVVRFTSPQRGRAELRLQEDGVLMGEYHLREGSSVGRTVGRPMRLQRAEPPR
jgi:hypothetical protein